MFYDDMATYYNEIFPVGTKAAFLHSHFEGVGPLLDVGCSNGNVSAELAALPYEIDALDLSLPMIAYAKAHNPRPETLRFHVMNMLSLDFPDASFGGVFCIGNTLVHLEAEDVDVFLTSAFRLLKPQGKLVLQILNYGAILQDRPESLPLIETDLIRFERHYQYRPSHIDFITRLTDRHQGIVHENTVPLYPLAADDLSRRLLDLGFIDLKHYGGYNRAPFSEKGLTAIVVCTKPNDRTPITT